MVKINSNIPIFRAKSIKTKEYIIGHLLPELKRFGDKTYIVPEFIRCDNGLMPSWEVDPTTISIHFPNMISMDSERYDPNGEKDLRIFASLQEDGKGGDIFEYKELLRTTQTHYGDNIPCGEYEEPLELEICTKASPVVFVDSKMCLLSDYDDFAPIELSYRINANNTNNVEELARDAYFEVCEADFEYIKEEYNLKTDKDILDYCKPKIIGIQE